MVSPRDVMTSPQDIEHSAPIMSAPALDYWADEHSDLL